MNGIDPKFTFWFGVWTNVLTLIAGYGIEHAPPLVAQFAPTVQWLAGFAAQANSVILTALIGVSSIKAGPLVNIPASMVKPLVLSAVILGGLFTFTGDARAQSPAAPHARPAINLDPLGLLPKNAPTSNDPLQNIIGALDAKLLPDLLYAKTMADASGSKVTGPCYGAWIDLINVRQKAVTGTDGQPLAFPDPGVISRFEQIVELRNALQPDSSFMIACSPVASMVKKDIVGFIGIVISGGAGLATLVPGL